MKVVKTISLFKTIISFYMRTFRDQERTCTLSSTCSLMYIYITVKPV